MIQILLSAVKEPRRFSFWRSNDTLRAFRRITTPMPSPLGFTSALKKNTAQCTILKKISIFKWHRSWPTCSEKEWLLVVLQVHGLEDFRVVGSWQLSESDHNQGWIFFVLYWGCTAMKGRPKRFRGAQWPKGGRPPCTHPHALTHIHPPTHPHTRTRIKQCLNYGQSHIIVQLNLHYTPFMKNSLFDWEANVDHWRGNSPWVNKLDEALAEAQPG